MSMKTNIAKAVGLGVVLATVSAGASFAAVSNSGTAVHRSPSYNSRIVNHLYRGEHVRLLDREGRWCEISIPGPNGWVRCSALGNYSLDRFRPGITFNFGFGFPGFQQYPPHNQPPHMPPPHMPPPYTPHP